MPKRRGPNSRTLTRGYGPRMVKHKFGADPVTLALIFQLIKLDKIPSFSDAVRRCVNDYVPRRLEEIARERAAAGAVDDAPSHPSQDDPRA